MDFIRKFFLFFSFTFILIPTAFSIEKNTIILGVHPFLSYSELIDRFTPLANYLSKELDTTVQLRIGSNYENHMEAIGNNIIDLAYIGPYNYINITRKYGQKNLIACIEQSEAKKRCC